MNGIDYNSFLSNTGLFSNQAANKDEASIFTGAVNRRAKSKTTEDKRQTNVDRDTYEYSGQVRDVQAGYSRPKRTEQTNDKGYKPVDSNGIQEGIKLSDSAKNLLDELREKYGNMDITVAEWSTDEEQDYYAAKTSKEYSVLINPELLEKMAADESVRAQYESVLGGAGDKLEELKEGLGDDADKVEGFSITMDKDGKISYAVKLLKEMNESSQADKKANASKTQQDRIEEKRAERKRLEKERVEKIEEKKVEKEKIEADSIDELIKAIKAKLYPDQYDKTEESDENTETETTM